MVLSYGVGYMKRTRGAEQVHLASITRFANFEKCPSKNKLATYIGEWEILRRAHGDMLPDIVRYAMLLNMLPEDVANMFATNGTCGAQHNTKPTN